MVTDIDLTRSINAIIALETKLGSLKHSEQAYPATAIEAIERTINQHKLELANNVLLLARATNELHT